MNKIYTLCSNKYVFHLMSIIQLGVVSHIKYREFSDQNSLEITKFENKFLFYCIFTLSNAKHGESIVIGLGASSTSKDPQVKTTEPMDTIKVTKCSNGLNFSSWRFCQKLHGVSSSGQKVLFFLLVRADWWMEVIVFLVHGFYHTVAAIEMKLKTYH